MISKFSSADFYRPNDVVNAEIWNALNPEKRGGGGGNGTSSGDNETPKTSGNNFLAVTAGSPEWNGWAVTGH